MTVHIHDLGWAEFRHGLVQRLDAEVGVHRVTEPPTQDLARLQIHDADKIEEAASHRYEYDVSAPDLVGSVDLHLPQQVRIIWMLRIRLTGFWALGDHLQAHRRHYPSDAKPPDNRSFPAQVRSDLT